MGCSSSSAQTVDQEKKPGAKPEESNGATSAVRNGIIAETTEDKTQLSESALADDLQQEADDGAALVVMESQEDLGSEEDLLTDVQPKRDPNSIEVPGSAAVPAEASNDSGFADVALEAMENLMAKPISEEESPTAKQAEVPAGENFEAFMTELPVVKDNDVIKCELPAVDEIKAERPNEDVKSVQAEVSAVVEQASAVPAGASPETATSVLEPVEANSHEAEAEVPYEVAPPLENATEKFPPPPALVTPEFPLSTEATLNEVEPPAGATADAASVEDSTMNCSEVTEPIIDTGIAVATIPEMPHFVPVTDEPQAEQPPAAVVMPSGTALQAEPAESSSLQEPASVAKGQVLEVPVSSTLLLETSSKEASDVSSLFEASPSVMSHCAIEVPAAEPTQAEIVASSSVTATDQVFETSTEVVSAAECHQSMEKETAKKED